MGCRAIVVSVSLFAVCTSLVTHAVARPGKIVRVELRQAGLSHFGLCMTRSNRKLRCFGLKRPRAGLVVDLIAPGGGDFLRVRIEASTPAKSTCPSQPVEWRVDYKQIGSQRMGYPVFGVAGLKLTENATANIKDVLPPGIAPRQQLGFDTDGDGQYDFAVANRSNCEKPTTPGANRVDCIQYWRVDSLGRWRKLREEAWPMCN